jgi:hypothetical protein
MTLFHENPNDILATKGENFMISANNNPKSNLMQTSLKKACLVLSNRNIDLMKMQTWLKFNWDDSDNMTFSYLQKNGFNVKRLWEVQKEMTKESKEGYNVSEVIDYYHDNYDKLFVKISKLLNKDKILFSTTDVGQFYLITPWKINLKYVNVPLFQNTWKNFIALIYQLLLPPCFHNTILKILLQINKTYMVPNAALNKLLEFVTKIVSMEPFRKQWIKKNYPTSYSKDRPSESTKNLNVDKVPNEGGDGIFYSYELMDRIDYMTYDQNTDQWNMTKDKLKEIEEGIEKLMDDTDIKEGLKIVNFGVLNSTIIIELQKILKDCLNEVDYHNQSKEFKKAATESLNRASESLDIFTENCRKGYLVTMNPNFYDPERHFRNEYRINLDNRDTPFGWLLVYILRYGKMYDYCIDLFSKQANLIVDARRKIMDETENSPPKVRKDMIGYKNQKIEIKDSHNIVLYRTEFDKTTLYRLLLDEYNFNNLIKEELVQDEEGMVIDDLEVEKQRALQNEQDRYINDRDSDTMFANIEVDENIVLINEFASNNYHGTRWIFKYLYPDEPLDSFVRTMAIVNRGNFSEVGQVPTKKKVEEEEDELKYTDL